MKLRRDNSQSYISKFIFYALFFVIFSMAGAEITETEKDISRAQLKFIFLFYLQCFSVFIYSHLGGQCCVNKNELARLPYKTDY